MDPIANARTRIHQAAERLQGIQREMEQVRESIPPSPQELSELDLPDRPDVPTELRGVLATMVPDYLGPLIRSLFAAARYGLEPPPDLDETAS